MHPENPKLQVEKPRKYQLEISLMRYMGWSFQELMNCPNDLIEILVEDLKIKQKWEDRKRKTDEQKEKLKNRN